MIISDKINFSKILIVIFFYLIFSNKAHAYFDPGTGSFIIQAILGILAAGFTTVLITWAKFKNFLARVFKRDQEKKTEKKDH